eukprot:6214741-Pleurochrysis_carterae.AAC.7
MPWPSPRCLRAVLSAAVCSVADAIVPFALARAKSSNSALRRANRRHVYLEGKQYAKAGRRRRD